MQKILAVLRAVWRFLNRWFAPVAIVGIVLGVGLTLWRQREAILTFNWQVDIGLAIAAAALFAVAPLMQGVSFWWMLRRSGGDPSFSDAMLIWGRSFAVRYAPTGALAFVLRVREGERLRSTRSQLLTVTAYENLMMANSGALAACIGFLVASRTPPTLLLVAGGVVLAIAIVLNPRLAGQWAQRITIRRGFPLAYVFRGRELFVATIWNTLPWLATGLAVSLALRAFTDTAPDIAYLVGAYGFAWLLGLLFPILPGGLALREATLISFLAPVYGLGSAVVLAVALRLINTIGEFVAIGAIEALRRLQLKAGR